MAAVPTRSRAELAVLDRHAVITAVNDAWAEFARENGAQDPAGFGIGQSYLAICEAAQDPASAQVASAIRRAIGGELADPERVPVPCDGPAGTRVFVTTVASRYADDGSCIGATVVLVPAAPSSVVPPAGSARPPAPPDKVPPVAVAAPPPDDRVVTLTHELLTSLGEASPDGLLLTDADGLILQLSAQLEVLTGYRAADLVGRPVEDLVPEEFRAAHLLLHARFRGAPRPRMMADGGTLALRRRDGSTLAVEIALRPARLEGRPVLLASIRDVSARRAAEEREELVAQALDAISDGVVVLDVRTGRRLYVNRAVLDRVGCSSREELEQVSIGAPSTPDEAEEIRAAIRAVVTGTAREVALDTNIAHREGGRLAVEMRIAHVPPGPGRPGLGRVLLVSRDITDRLAAQQQLRASEASFRAVFERSPIGVLVARLDPGGQRRIVRLNQAAADLFGEPVERLIGVDAGVFTLAEDRVTDAEAAARIARDELAEYSRLKCYQRRDGSRFWAEVRAERIELPDLPGPLAVLHLVDVTERQQAVERLQVSEESFRTVFEQAPIAAAVIRLTDGGRHRRIVLANPALAVLLGERIDQLVGMDLAGYTVPDQESPSRAIAEEFLRGRRDHVSRVTRYRRRDGSRIWVDFNATTITLPSVDGVTLLAFLKDITVQREDDLERRQRARLTQLVADVTTAILAGTTPEQVYQEIVTGAAALLDADDATLGFVEPSGDARPIAAVGPISGALGTGVLPVQQDLVRRLAGRAQCRYSVPMPDLLGSPAAPGALVHGAAARAAAGRDRACLITVARAGSDRCFTDSEVALLAEIVRQLALVIELGEARKDQEWLALLEERQRIARDLHDTVTQDIISVGMQLDQGLGGELDPERHTHRDAVITQLEQAVQRLRGTVYDLERTDPAPGILRTVRGIAADASRALGFPVALTAGGPLDKVSGDVAHHATAVLQEALANVVRHARATTVGVSVTTAGGVLTVIVEDDGCGIPPAHPRGHGLANLAERAHHLGGAFGHEPGHPTGTRLTWRVPARTSSPHDT